MIHFTRVEKYVELLNVTIETEGFVMHVVWVSSEKKHYRWDRKILKWIRVIKVGPHEGWESSHWSDVKD